MLKVLVYHKIEDSFNFERQMVFLKEHYTIISCLDLTNYKEISAKEKKPPLLITFDDGDISLYNNAYPILKKYSFPAVIFVITNLIGSKKPFWWDNISYHASPQEDSNALIWKVKSWPNEKRIVYIEDLIRNSGKKELCYNQLTYDQLLEMQSDGIDIANHSHTHPLFDRCTREEIKSEMESSIDMLKTFGFLYDVFAYPNGYFSPESEREIKTAGIKIAFIFDHNINKKIDNSLRVSRLIVNDSTPLWKFRFILSGWHSRLLPIKRKILRLKHKWASPIK